MEHFVKNKTERPNVAFGCVLFVFEDLKRHIQRSTYDRLDFKVFVRNFFSKPKIADFENFIFDHNVGRFEIPVDDTFPGQNQKTVTNLGQHVYAIVLFELGFWSHYFADIPITEFLDDVVVFATFHDIDKLDDIGVMD